MSKPIAILVAIVLAIVGFYLLQQSFADPVDGSSEPELLGNQGAGGNLQAARNLEGDEQETAPDGESTRVAVPEEASAPNDPKLGALLVRVLWPDDTPAADVAVVFYSRGAVVSYSEQKLTDAEGVARYESVTPGKKGVRTDRGGRVTAEVVAGKTAEATVKLEGLDVQGVVVDSTGRGVAGASIWLTRAYRRDWLGGRVVGQSHANGEFRLRGVPPDQSLGALAKGFSPSKLVDMDDVDTTKAPVRLRLVLTDRGGNLVGVVKSPKGEPLPGAEVYVGRQPGYPRSRHGSDGYIEDWSPVGTTTDEQGRFERHGVAPGKHPVAVRARGLPVWKGEVEVIVGETARMEIQLLSGVVVHGVVTDEAGKRVAGAVVRAYDKALKESFIQGGQFDYVSVFPFRFTSADGQGRYRLTGVPPGSIHLYAHRAKTPRHGGGNLLRAKKVLHGEAGEELEWNAIIEAGNQITGLVTYKNGTPMTHCFINLRNEKTNDLQALITDRKGRFRFTNLKLAHYKVGVQYPFGEPPKGTPPLEKGKVWPNTGEVRLVASFDPPNKEPKGSVIGRIDDAGGRRSHVAPFGVLLRSVKNYWHTGKADKDGAFKFTGITPGRFRLIIMSGEDQILTSDWFDVAPAQKHDVGTLVTEPGGSLRIRLQREKGTEKVEPRLWATHLGNKQYREIRPGVANEHLEKNLTVGSYEVRVTGKGMMNSSLNVEVKMGQVTIVDLPLRRGLLRWIRFPWPEGAGRLSFEFHDDKGAVVLKNSYGLSAAFPNPYNRAVYLPPGRYTVKARVTQRGTKAAGAGKAGKAAKAGKAGKAGKNYIGEQSFVIQDSKEVAPTVVVELKPAR